jgi:ornithine carbamoyltransferase
VNHFLSLADWEPAQLLALLDLAARVKATPRAWRTALAGRVLLCLFEKPSLRTRVSFEVAMLRLGGHALDYDLGRSPWRAGKETAGDTARTASRYVDALLARLFSDAELRALAAEATVPVVNGLTDREHPCQALADLYTLRERHGGPAGRRLAYLGDGNNNVTHSLLDAGALLGCDVVVACPPAPGFAPDPAILARASRRAAETGGRVGVTHDPAAAVAGAHAVYTDTWMSYHTPPETLAARTAALAPYRVTAARLAGARRDAILLHCLPARRDQEVDAAVLDGPQSAVFDQAENRLWTEMALLLTLLGAA